MRVLMAGASGMIGSEVMRALTDGGHTVLQLVRHVPREENQFGWTPEDGFVDTGLFDRVDAVINLSGASISRLPWTPAYKRELLASRISATRTLVEGMRRAKTPPAVFLSGSAEGFYGDRPDELLTEESAAGTGFLSGLVQQWESEALRAPSATRVVLLRTGIVLDAGGALGPIRLLTTLGVSGPLGGGTQHWPWISMRDEVGAIVHLLTSSVSGPVNLVGPEPATADDIMRRLAAEMHRPYLVPAPAFALRLALGDAAQDLLLADRRISPTVLLDDGFSFAHPDMTGAVDEALARANGS
ncbi:TIGR01777 family oxidoreductase [Planctomonas psychrotolerans]|uniref:TIGR01777 family oxidoreductase n=1 Tax=Planctomonas psychrotolerans TaxID=2528712 RepID=UPI00123B02C7|nr:TIGR01777 family oxidoreductase [Planctomonas psychrotolerans]